MAVDPANARELARIAGEVGADVLEGALRYPSDTGGWQLGDLDLSENLDRYRDRFGFHLCAATSFGQSLAARDG